MFDPRRVGIDYVLPAVNMQFLLLSIIVLVFRRYPQHGLRLVLPLTFAATTAVYALSTWISLRDVREYERLRAQFPYESLEDRLPLLAAPRAARLSAASGARLAALEERAEKESWSPPPRHMINRRARDLEVLHERTVRRFVDSAGFGVGRLTVGALRERLSDDPGTGTPVPQPVPRTSATKFPGGPESMPPLSQAYPGFDALNEDSVLDFANLAGAGFVKDRRHVAGFRPHRLSKVPAPPEEFAVETVDLLGLLTHPEPVAYVSANLPRMDELRAAPTRPLDTFESAGLKEIRQGEDLVFGEAGTHLRLVGSIRNARQCVDCHGGQRGDLLGAFSYTLRRKSS